MRIAFVTETWLPSTDGVVTRMTSTIRELRRSGHDVLIIAPEGLTASQIARLGKIRGLRSMITFDGAEITTGGRPVSVIGVNPATFRSWVPLASGQAAGLELPVALAARH